jgi:hypothetical protein
MDSRGQAASKQWAPPVSPTRSARRSYGYLIAALLLGIIMGILSILLVFLFGGGDRPAVPPSSSSSSKDAVVVQLSKTFLSQLIQKKADFSALPGTVSNVQVAQIQQNSITITADDQVGILGVSTTKQFTLTLQPIVSNCVVRMHVLHADLQGVPVTNVAATFEDQINQQLAQTGTALPGGFTYCATQVRTEAQAVIISYSATPQ